MTGLTPLGHDLVLAFNARWRYGRCSSCGVLAAVRRDGQKYVCAIPKCAGTIENVLPGELPGTGLL